MYIYQPTCICCRNIITFVNMASVDQKNHLTFERLHRLLLVKGRQALKNALDVIHPPDKLLAALEENKTSLQKLRPRVFNDERWKLLFPPADNPPDSKTFDMKLLIILLENICGLQPAEKGWDTMPSHMDISLQTNVTRIKLIENKVGISKVTSADNDGTTFVLKAMWENVSQSLVEMGIPQKEIDQLIDEPDDGTKRSFKGKVNVVNYLRKCC